MSTPLIILEIDCNWDDQRCLETLPLLQPESRERANRYLCMKSRRALISSHRRLDQLVEACGGDPTSLRKAENGRPYLEDGSLEFNLSHSHQRAALIVGRDPSLKLSMGVDIEWVDRRTDIEGLSERFFTPQEHRWVAGNRDHFFHIWTRKEALLKSNGVGLRVELDSFQVLEDRVGEDICGKPLHLMTSPRSGHYLISWALPGQDFTVHWLQDSETDWAHKAAQLLNSDPV